MLTFYCGAVEADIIATTLRAHGGLPVHVRAETVHGRDFTDANVSEQVTGTLDRAAVDLVAPRDKADALIAAVGAARRAHAVRWVMTPVLARGRLP